MIMRSDVTNGIVSGLVAGVFFGIMMQMMNAPTPEGGQMPMMAMVAKVVRSDSMAVGWIYHLFNSAVIGAIFGWLLGNRSHTFAPGARMGRAVWVRVVDTGGIDFDAAISGMQPFAPLMMAPMRPVALGSLIGHLLYGAVVGGGFAMLQLGLPEATPQHKPHQR